MLVSILANLDASNVKVTWFSENKIVSLIESFSLVRLSQKGKKTHGIVIFSNHSSKITKKIHYS